MAYGGLTIANGTFTVMNGLDGGSRESSFEQLGGVVLGASGHDAGKMIDEFPLSTPSRAIRGIAKFVRRKLSADNVQAITEQALVTSEKSHKTYRLKMMTNKYIRPMLFISYAAGASLVLSLIGAMLDIYIIVFESENFDMRRFIFYSLSALLLTFFIIKVKKTIHFLKKSANKGPE